MRVNVGFGVAGVGGIVERFEVGVFAFDVAEQRLDQGSVDGRGPPAEVLGDRAHGHELGGVTGAHFRAVVADTASSSGLGGLGGRGVQPLASSWTRRMRLSSRRARAALRCWSLRLGSRMSALVRAWPIRVSITAA
ncbi:MAG: hypothetical protein KTU85_11345 [Acidimicrobiia bacterium]|nr:hypothetical protein [Acidimicrobiia bacterium]